VSSDGVHWASLGTVAYYIGIVDGPRQAYLVWTDSRNAVACPAVDTYRSQVYAGEKPAAQPRPDLRHRLREHRHHQQQKTWSEQLRQNANW